MGVCYFGPTLMGGWGKLEESARVAALVKVLDAASDGEQRKER